jgi:hypothetical protein
MVVKGPWSSAALKAVRGRGVKEIELNYAKGWRKTDLSFLRELSDLKALNIIDRTIDDVSPVNELRSLRRLQV